MANIPISSLPEVTSVTDNDYLAVDNGSTSSKIKINKFNESATASAAAYAAAAAESASAAEDYKDAAQTAKSETQNLITSAQTLVSDASTYAGNAQTSANNASTYAGNASNSASAAATSATQAAGYANGVSAYATEAKSYAEGGTGTRSGEDTDNAQYYANLAHTHEQDASNAASAASGSASDASDYKNAASGSATSASASALVAEGYAAGTQNGEAVSSGPYYHNNAAYYADQASGSATAASNQADRAETAVVKEPYIGDNNNWYVWDWETNAYVDSQIKATGPKGDTGSTGNGIVSITKTSTSGLVDTYTILYTNGNTDTLTVTNGQDGTGSGDMTKADYDSTEAVHNAGGIVAYVAAQLSGFSTNLSGLSDVDLTSLSAGQTLIYDATTEKWVNASLNLGTAASKDVAASGDASNTQVVMGNDSRLTDARTPVSHTHTKSEITDFPTLGTAAAKDSTNAVTQNSTDLVESGAVYTEINSLNSAIANEAETRAKLGAHNLLRPAFFSTTTISGVTYTSNNDGTYVLNGTSTGDPSSIALFEDVTLDSIGITDLNSDYILSKGIDDTLNYGVQIAFYLNGTQTGRVQARANGPITFNFKSYSFDTVSISLVVGKTVSLNNVLLKPMLRLATDAYSEYTPYVPTNAELLPADTNAVLGAHQLLSYDLASLKAKNTSGTWNNNVYTPTAHPNLSFTVNSDLSITVSGTSSNAIIGFDFSSQDFGATDIFSYDSEGVPVGDYILTSNIPNGGANGNICFRYASSTHNTSIIVWGNQTVNVTVKPLIRYKGDPSTMLTPYAMTNKELTDVVTATHSLGSRVDISSYNSSNNKYTCPSDGYAYIQLDNDSNCTYLSMMLSGGTAATTIYKPSSGNVNRLVYVPKGMTVYFDYDNASPTKIVCRFIPIV